MQQKQRRFLVVGVTESMESARTDAACLKCRGHDVHAVPLNRAEQAISMYNPDVLVVDAGEGPVAPFERVIETSGIPIVVLGSEDKIPYTGVEYHMMPYDVMVLGTRIAQTP